MDLKQLEYIVKIADENSITRAAERLYISQSGLNQQLLKLENELGIRIDDLKLKIDSLKPYDGKVYSVQKYLIPLRNVLKSWNKFLDDVKAEKRMRLIFICNNL